MLAAASNDLTEQCCFAHTCTLHPDLGLIIQYEQPEDCFGNDDSEADSQMRVEVGDHVKWLKGADVSITVHQGNICPKRGRCVSVL